jgi:hypothetical protein
VIPVATTTVKTWRKDSEIASTEDPWDDGYPDDVTADFAILDEGVRAVISVGGGTYAGREVGPGTSEAVAFNMLADPTDLQYLDEVEDEITGQRYAVEWVVHNPGVGGILASTRAGLSTRKGA